MLESGDVGQSLPSTIRVFVISSVANPPEIGSNRSRLRRKSQPDLWRRVHALAARRPGFAPDQPS